MRTAVAVAAAGLAFAACRTARPKPDRWREASPQRHGVYHTVEAGQTLWRIARAYGVSVQRLTEVNHLADRTELEVGQRLWIPGAKKVLHVEPAPGMVRPPPPATASAKPAAPAAKPASRAKVAVRHARFLWPVKGVLFSRFGVRNGTEHDGIDISAPKGTPIHAADAGKVLFSGVERGYGNIILLQHADGLITIYAHCETRKVKAGERVRRGEVIGLVGQTGRATGPHLHFEVREHRMPRNPLLFLP